ncbi:MAG: Kelch repeat-containing protein [Candidatus Thorarchaeota archaeon]
MSYTPAIAVNPVASIDSLNRDFTIADQADLPTRGNVGMAYDNESDLVIIFGGWNNTPTTASKTDVLTYDYNIDTYTQKSPSTTPDGRAEPGFAYDSMRDRMVLFGGMRDINTNDRLNDTWLYNTNTDTWTEVLPTLAPSERRAHGMVYDSESDRFIIFGGEDGDVLNDTWAFDPGTNLWTQMSPSLAPSHRFAHKMVYDSESDRVILFGGYNGGSVNQPSSYFGDTWVYDFNTDSWENVTPTSSPSSRGVPSLAYDSESDRIVLFGGSNGGTAYSDTWLFDYNSMTWTEMNPTVHPDVRSRHGSAYDWESDRVIIYGGTRTGFSTTVMVSETDGKTWSYDVNSNTWQRLDQSPPSAPIPIEWIAIGVGGLVLVMIVIVLVKRR